MLFQDGLSHMHKEVQDDVNMKSGHNELQQDTPVRHRVPAK
jgi:hypothetical protein